MAEYVGGPLDGKSVEFPNRPFITLVRWGGTWREAAMTDPSLADGLYERKGQDFHWRA